MADHLGTLDAVQSADEEALSHVDGIGPAVARSMMEFFRRPATRRVIQQCLENGLELGRPAHRARTPLTGKTVVFTGALEAMSRDEAEGLVTELGGHASGSVSAHTDLVVAGRSPGSKYEKATDLGVTIITEEEFLKLVRRPAEPVQA